MNTTKVRTPPSNGAAEADAPNENRYRRTNPEAEAKINDWIKSNSRNWEYIQAMPRDRLERTVVLNEIRQLERRQYVDTGVLQNIKNNPDLKAAYDLLLKDVPEAQRDIERLANLQQDLAVRQDTSSGKFRIELDGQTLDNRGVAGELLLRRAEKIKSSFGANARVGKFAGFDLSLHASYNNEVELLLHGKNSYSARVTDTALGTIRSLESIVQGFEDRTAGLERDIRDSQKRAKEFEAKVGAPFEHEKRYHQLAERQSEIEEKLDLTKNQAPSQVEDKAEDETDEKISQRQDQTKTKEQSRRAALRV